MKEPKHPLVRITARAIQSTRRPKFRRALERTALTAAPVLCIALIPHLTGCALAIACMICEASPWFEFGSAIAELAETLKPGESDRDTQSEQGGPMQDKR